MEKNLLVKKKILIVSEDAESLKTLAGFFPQCQVVQADTFKDAWNLLGTDYFDIAILDMIGTEGFRLLSLAQERKIIGVMLKSRAPRSEDTIKSYGNGRMLFVSKDEMPHITFHLNNLLISQEKKKRKRWSFEKIGAFFQGRQPSDGNASAPFL